MITQVFFESIAAIYNSFRSMFVISYLRIFILITSFAFTLLSCSKGTIDNSEKIEVAINVDWSESGLKSNSEGATCVFYPTTGGGPIKVLMGDRNYEKTSLPKGQYNVLVFNRTFGEFASITFLEEDKFETIKACLKEEYTRSANLLASPDELAVATYANWQLDGTTTEIRLTPRKITQQIEVKLIGVGLENVYSAMGRLTGMPEAVKLADGSISESVNMQLFNFNKTLTRAEGVVEYSLEATFNTFGFDEEVKRKLHFAAQLRDGKTVVEEELKVDNIVIDKETGEEVVYIELAIPNLPEVEPSISPGSSFDVVIDKWGDEENNQIPV